MLLKELLYVSFNKCLFVRQPMILSSAVLDLMLALVFPIELELNVASSGSYREGTISKFNDLLLNESIVDTIELWVHLKVGRNDFDCHLDKRFDVSGWKGLFVTLAGFCDLDCDFVIIKCFVGIDLCLTLSGTFLCLNLGGFLCRCCCKIALFHFT